MNKTYMGIPGPVPLVTVTQGAETSPLPTDAQPFGWGKLNPGGAALARAILLDYLGDEAKVREIHGRFKWRTVSIWQTDQPWTLTGAQIDAHLRDIASHEPDIERARAEAARSPAMVAREGGIGIDGAMLPKITVDGRTE